MNLYKGAYLNFEQRQIILQNIKFVDKVIPQKTLDYVQNLKIVKPDFVVHGDDWKKGIQKKTRARVIKALKEWALMSKSLDTYLAVGEDQRAYHAIIEANRKHLGKQVLYGGVPTSLKLTRHRK